MSISLSIIAALVLIFGIVLLGKALHVIESYDYRLHRLDQKLNEYNSNIHSLSVAITVIEQQNENNLKTLKKIENSIILPDTILEAVKLAMKVTHPDNGGEAAEFVKYRDLYDALTK